MINKVLDDPSLSWKEKGIFVTIATFPDDFTADKLVELSVDGLAGVRAGVNNLISKGYIKRVYMSTGAKGVRAKLVVVEEEDDAD